MCLCHDGRRSSAGAAGSADAGTCSRSASPSVSAGPCVRPERLVFYCRTTSASTAPCTSRRMCCPTHCASYCAPCQPHLRAFSGWIRCVRPLSGGLLRGASSSKQWRQGGRVCTSDCTASLDWPHPIGWVPSCHLLGSYPARLSRRSTRTSGRSSRSCDRSRSWHARFSQGRWKTDRGIGLGVGRRLRLGKESAVVSSRDEFKSVMGEKIAPHKIKGQTEIRLQGREGL